MPKKKSKIVEIKNTLFVFFLLNDLGFGFFENEGLVGGNVIINVFVFVLHFDETRC